jgi:hypothetical protein
VSAGCKRGVDAWDQQAWVWDAAFYSLLALITALGMLDEPPGPRTDGSCSR